ncbi:hypothetical protein PF008_g27178 [Phytophthora fragariae]|uniref:Uncharacterized protein n=1 Tax=Phytophthora fragariae TaxID=53985 RepID=A0A6G0QEW4_9STRA|nr:hypothetical protein PF008_g27178 [Phytophthora fragariae]
MRSTTNRAISLAVCADTATATAYLVAYSTAATTYRLPRPVTSNGPATSNAHRSPTFPRPKGRSGGITSRGRAFLVPQSRQLCTHCLTVVCISGNQYTAAMRVYVCGIRKCPANIES